MKSNNMKSNNTIIVLSDGKGWSTVEEGSSFVVTATDRELDRLEKGEHPYKVFGWDRIRYSQDELHTVVGLLLGTGPVKSISRSGKLSLESKIVDLVDSLSEVQAKLQSIPDNP